MNTLYRLVIEDEEQECIFSFDAYEKDIEFGQNIYDHNTIDVTDTRGNQYGFPLTCVVSITRVATITRKDNWLCR